MIRENIDGGKAFDWGKASADYALYRDIYPDEFYKKLIDSGLCIKGQSVLDIGTGTGVLPRNMYKYGAKWTGADISPGQIAQAKALSSAMNMDIKYIVSSAEDITGTHESIDVITACQCYWYFDTVKTSKAFARLLKPGGKLVFLVMNWLPLEDEIAAETEQLVLKYNPDWSGANDTFHAVNVDDEYYKYFDKADSFEYRLPVHFTRESWNGRIKACRGIGASSLSDEQKRCFESEHLQMLSNYPEEFDILHYCACAVLKKK